MDLSSDQIIQNIIKGQFANNYFLVGEEPFYIDQIMAVIETKIIPEDQRDFNQIVFYGAETDRATLIQEARGFPMFGDRKLVILKDAANMKQFADLTTYFEDPMPTTVLVIEYKGANLDKRSKLYKLIDSKSTIFKAEKIKDWDLSKWIVSYCKSIHISISAQLADVLATYLGNDLKKISHEIEKVKINVPDINELTPQLVEKYIGISREYNMFELPAILFGDNTEKLARILAYFDANPKSAPMPPILANIYSFLSKVYLCHFLPKNNATDKENKIYFFHREIAKKYSVTMIHKLMAILEQYSHMSVGVDSIGANANYLLKEMIGKMRLVTY